MFRYAQHDRSYAHLGNSVLAQSRSYWAIANKTIVNVYYLWHDVTILLPEESKVLLN